MSSNNCDRCGGPLRRAWARCRFCGVSLAPSPELAEEDRLRLVAVASILDWSLWRHAFEAAHRVNRRYVAANVVLLAVVSAAVYAGSSSWGLAGACVATLAGLVLVAYHLELWFAVDQSAKARAWEERIEPTIERFLHSHAYPGDQWERVVRDLIDEGRLLTIKAVMRVPVAAPEGSEALDAVLDNLADQLSTRTYATHSRTTVLRVLAVGYLGVLLTVPLWFLLGAPAWPRLVEPTWVPLAWLVPLLGWLYFEVAGKAELITGDIPYHPDRRFVRTRLLPLVEEYCRATSTDAAALVQRAEELELSVLASVLRRAGFG